MFPEKNLQNLDTIELERGAKDPCAFGRTKLRNSTLSIKTN